jgi:hypothetical protein
LAAILTVAACLLLVTGPAEVRSASLYDSQAQQSTVVASLERYARGEFDEAVKQLLGTKTVRSVLKDFRKDADAWIGRAPEGSRAQRIAVTGAMSLELFAATFEQHVDEYSKTRELIEWACERFRRLPPSEAERWFHLSAIALAQGVDDKRFIDGYGQRFFILGSHADHPRERFPREARFKLAFATANPEATLVATWPLPPGYLVSRHPWTLDYQDDQRLMDGSLQMLTELFDDPALSAEARLRSGVLRFLRRDVTVARTDLAHAEQADDAAVRSVAQLMLGAIADQAGDSKEALRRYWLAWDAAPAATTSVALASRLFRSNATEDAANILRQFASSTPLPDPWEMYGQRDFRFFDAYRQQMRWVVAPQTERPVPDARPAALRAGPMTLAPVRTGTADVGVAVLVQSGGEPVTDLKSEDFSLTDSGVLQDITGVERETRALDVTVVATEVTTLRSGKYQTLDPEIEAVARVLTPADRLTVMLAGRDPRSYMPPGSRDLLREAELERRCVPVYDTLVRALITPVSPGRQRVVFVLTPGEGRGGFLATGPAAEIAKRANARVYVARVEPYLRRDIFIAEAQCPEVSMDFSKEREDRLRFVTLQDVGKRIREEMGRLVGIAESTGGREIKQEVLRQSPTGSVRDALEEVRASYVLRYTPKGVPDTGWHPITVKLTKPGSYDIRVRPGYER